MIQFLKTKICKVYTVHAVNYHSLTFFSAVMTPIITRNLSLLINKEFFCYRMCGALGPVFFNQSILPGSLIIILQIFRIWFNFAEVSGVMCRLRAMPHSAGSNFAIEYLYEYKCIFETALAYDSGGPWILFDEKKNNFMHRTTTFYRCVTRGLSNSAVVRRFSDKMK
jgi:hypothetical protein